MNKRPAPAADLPAAAATAELSPRRQRRAGEILAAAREVFIEKGFAGASVSEIAAKVGVVEGLVFSYFPSKRELLNEVMRGVYEPLIDEIEQSFAHTTGLRARLRFLIWRQLRVFVEDPQLGRLVLHEVRTSPEYSSTVLRDILVRYSQFTLRTVREAIAAGELPADTDAELLRSLVYGGIEHHMWATLFGHGKVDVEQTADRFTDMLLSGIAPPAAPSPGSQADMERRLARLERLVADGMAPAGSRRTRGAKKA